MNYIDLFAGAGGLSEGFQKQGYKPVAHVEMDRDACETLRTRLAYHYLHNTKNDHFYYSWLKKEITRETLLQTIPEEILRSVLNFEISETTLPVIFKEIDAFVAGRKIDLIIGGPPCQAYSLVGRARDPNSMTGDSRNYLFRYYGEFLRRYKPQVFVFENVLGLLSAGNTTYMKEMISLFEHLGYKVLPQILNASDYGVIQHRKRVVIIGVKTKSAFNYPDFEKYQPNLATEPDIFEDLPDLRPGEELEKVLYRKSKSQYCEEFGIKNGVDFTTQHITRPHNERDLEIYEIAINLWRSHKKRLHYYDLPERLKTHKNQESFTDRFKVVDHSGCSHTMVAHIAKDGHYFIHPGQKHIRSLSVREAARIQSFPDNYYFEGGRSPAFRQIGNAVPPLMAEAIALGLKKLF
jgi:DNA (cytosine-5)-methyltransferase 1